MMLVSGVQIIAKYYVINIKITKQNFLGKELTYDYGFLFEYL